MYFLFENISLTYTLASNMCIIISIAPFFTAIFRWRKIESIFFYGLIFMIPAVFIFNFKIELYRFYNLYNLMNILYLGLGAFALCFVTWNWSVKVLGVKTSVYIYMVSMITASASAAILVENITRISILGIAFTLVGLSISSGKQFIRLGD